MAAGYATLLAASLVAVAGCINDRGFSCSDSTRCVLGGVAGRCEATGWCSYPDPDCEGGNRYEALAEDGVAGQCVDRLCGVTHLVAGAEHNCAVDAQRRVWCWGANDAAQLGTGATSPAVGQPRLATALLGAGQQGYLVPVSASSHACGVGEGNTVLCWGLNDASQVTYEDAPPRVLEPILVNTPTATAIAVGERVSCVATDDELSCWGDAAPSPDAATTIQLPDTILEVDAGALHVCGRTATLGAVYCAGDPSNGRLGGTIQNGGPVDFAVPLAAGARMLATGQAHSCAIVGDDARQDVWCWGRNDMGQSGAAPTALPLPPTKVVALANGQYVDIAAGGQHTCVLRADGRIWCWGDNIVGQVKIGGGVGDFGPTEVAVDGQPLIAEQVVAGRSHTCARTTRALVCWGANGSLQLGSDELSTRVHTTEFDCD